MTAPTLQRGSGTDGASGDQSQSERAEPRLAASPLLPDGFSVPASRRVHPATRFRRLLETEPYLFGPGVYGPFGTAYDAARLGSAFVEALPEEKVV
jgi:hypothetical protein